MNEQIRIDFSRIGEKEDLTQEEITILRLLQRGRQRALSVNFLASETGLSEVELREKIRHLIMEHNVLIASSVQKPCGYFIADSENEIKDATKSLRHRGIMILMRAAKLQKISLEGIFHQARIEYREG